MEEALNFLWSISNQEIESHQKKLIINFWFQVVPHVLDVESDNSRLCEYLIRLISYFDDFDDKVAATFLKIIPQASIKDSSYFVVNHLIRLFEKNPKNVSRFSAAYIEKSEFRYDYESRWLHLTKLIRDNESCKSDADSIILAMQNNPGFKELYLSNPK